MNDPQASDRDVSRAIRSWLHEDRHEDASRVAGAVLDHVEATPRRRATWWPTRRTLDIMNKLVPLGLGAAAVVVALIIGYQSLGPAAPGGVGGSPSAEPTPIQIGGTVEYVGDGLPTTTEVTAVMDGASVSGTAVTSSSRGVHTVKLECGARDGDIWVLAGKVESTTLPGESAGHWSAVIVKQGAPQQIGIWLSVDPEGGLCEGLEPAGFSDIGPENFNPVESGELVPPPDLAP